MAYIAVPTGSEDYTPPELLSNGKYTMRTVRVSEVPSKKGLVMDIEILDGPPQPNDSDPQGRSFTYFQNTSQGSWKDGKYKNEQIDNVKAMIRCHELDVVDGQVDTDDMMGREYQAIVGRGKDQYDVPINEIKKFLVAE